MKKMCIIATSPRGECQHFQCNEDLWIAEQSGPNPWSVHRKSDNALIGLVPKTWTLKWEYEDGLPQ